MALSAILAPISSYWPSRVKSSCSTYRHIHRTAFSRSIWHAFRLLRPPTAALLPSLESPLYQRQLQSGASSRSTTICAFNASISVISRLALRLVVSGLLTLSESSTSCAKKRQLYSHKRLLLHARTSSSGPQRHATISLS